MTGAFYQRVVFIATNFLFLLVITYHLLGGLNPSHRVEDFYYTAQYSEKKPLSSAQLDAYVQSRKKFYRTLKRLLGALVIGYFIYAGGGGSPPWWWQVQLSLPLLLVSRMRRWEKMDPEGFRDRPEGEVALAVVEDKSFLGKWRGLFDFGEMKLIAVVKTSQRLILYGCKDERVVPSTNPCRACGTVSRCLKERGTSYVEYKDLPVFGLPVRLRVRKDRLRCHRCDGKSFTLSFSLLSPVARITKRLQYYLRRKLGDGDRETLARILEVEVHYLRQEEQAVTQESQPTAWYEAPDIVQSREPLKPGIDEHSVRKGHRYVTILYDKVRKKLLAMIEGRTADEVLEKLFKVIPKPIQARIESLTMDRCKAYLSAGLNGLGRGVLIVIDKFHIVRDAGKALQKVRKRWKAEEGKAIEKEYREQIKGLGPEEAKKVKKRENPLATVRNVLLVNPRKLKVKAGDSDKAKKYKREAQKKLKTARSLSPELKQAYRLFNEFRNLLDDTQIGKEEAKKRLSRWYQRVEKSQIKEPMILKKSFGSPIS